jgi:hypothetical protein
MRMRSQITLLCFSIFQSDPGKLQEAGPACRIPEALPPPATGTPRFAGTACPRSGISGPEGQQSPLNTDATAPPHGYCILVTSLQPTRPHWGHPHSLMDVEATGTFLEPRTHVCLIWHAGMQGEAH